MLALELILTLALILAGYYLIETSSKPIIEGYDSRYTSFDLNKCAEFCKTRSGCFGFGYDKNKKVCYPAKRTLWGKPFDVSVLFRDEYSKNNITCNKLQPVLKPGSGITFDKRRKNSVYVCTEKEGLQPQWYLHSFDRFKNLGEGRNIDEIFDIDQYAVKAYKWPINKYDMEQLDLLEQNRANQSFTEQTVTQLSRMETPDPEPVPELISLPPPEPKEDPQLDFGLEGLKRNVARAGNKIRKSIWIPSTVLGMPNFSRSRGSKDDVISDKIDKTMYHSKSQMGSSERLPWNHDYIVYKEINDYNTGEYMNNYKCVCNIPKQSCLEYCTDRNECVGVEWNPTLGGKSNLCCPKKSIGKFVPRKGPYCKGKFYQKKLVNSIDNKKTYSFSNISNI